MFSQFVVACRNLFAAVALPFQRLFGKLCKRACYAWLTVGLYCGNGLAGVWSSARAFIEDIELVSCDAMKAVLGSTEQFDVVADSVETDYKKFSEMNTIYVTSPKESFVYEIRRKGTSDLSGVIYRLDFIIPTQGVLLGSTTIPRAVYFNNMQKNKRYDTDIPGEKGITGEAVCTMVIKAWVECAERNGRLPLGYFYNGGPNNEELYQHPSLKSVPQKVYTRQNEANGASIVKLYHQHFKPIGLTEDSV